jgi:hypothetical protein
MNRYLYPVFKRPIYTPLPIRVGDRVRITESYFEKHDNENEWGVRGEWGTLNSISDGDDCIVFFDDFAFGTDYRWLTNE